MRVLFLQGGLPIENPKDPLEINKDKLQFDEYFLIFLPATAD